MWALIPRTQRKRGYSMKRTQYTIQARSLMNQARRLVDKGDFENAKRASLLATKVKESQRPVTAVRIREFLSL